MVERVIIAPGAEGLGVMLGELIRHNLAQHPDRAALLDEMDGRINVHAIDAEVEVGMLFMRGELSVGTVLDDPDIEIETDSATLLDLSNVPLRFGRPDALTPQGRAVIAKIASGKLKVHGMFKRGKLLSQFQRLLTVA